MAANDPPPTPNVVFNAFQYEECVVKARDIPYVKCPVHGELPLEYIAPDTVRKTYVTWSADSGQPLNVTASFTIFFVELSFVLRI